MKFLNYCIGRYENTQEYVLQNVTISYNEIEYHIFKMFDILKRVFHFISLIHMSHDIKSKFHLLRRGNFRFCFVTNNWQKVKNQTATIS